MHPIAAASESVSESVQLATETGQNFATAGMIVLLGLIVLTVLCVYLFSTAIARGRRRPSTPGGMFRDAAVLCATVALALYVYGVMCYLRLESAYHTCMLERYGSPGTAGTPAFETNEDSLLPVSSTCTWSDGYTLDFVPAFVNPAIALLLAAALASGVVAGRAVLSERNPARRG